MDYQLNIYPSSEIEMKNLKSENTHKHIKVICDNKLAVMYKKSFDAAVLKYNERVTSGKLIDNYLKSISESNIPEIYRLSIVIRYEPVKAEEGEAINKAFTEFKKKLDEDNKLVIVSAFTTAQNEYKTLEIFFYPVCKGFVTGLEVRNDLIGIVKQIEGMDSAKEINIIQAMPLFVKYIEGIFNEVNNGQFLSQEELEEMARRQDINDPLILHAIAINTLKTQMNEMDALSRESQDIEDAVEREKNRIKNDFEFVAIKEKEILAAEEARLEAERQLELERQRIREEQRRREAQRREEERLMEESRRLEAKRFAEQAKRNIEMHNQMAKQVAPAVVEVEQRRTIEDAAYFNELIERHIKWQEYHNVTKETNYNKISRSAMTDPRRLSLVNVDFIGLEMSLPLLVGVSFKNCTFTDCVVTADIYSSSFESCRFINTQLPNTRLTKCAMSGLTLDRTRFDSIALSVTAIMKTSFSNCIFSKVDSKFKNSYTKCNFENSQFDECNFRKSSFADCNFEYAQFVNSDMRETVFQSCKTGNIENIDSLFRGSNLEI